MARIIFGLLGVVMALYPERARDTYERFAFTNPNEVRAKPTFIPAIRAEGVVFVLISLAGGKAYNASMYVLGLAGAIEWNEGLVSAIRCFGVLYLLIALKEITNRKMRTATT